MNASAVRLLLATALVFVGLIGGSEAGQFVVGVRAISAAIGAAFVGVYIVRAPRSHDRLDLVVLAALVAFLLTCVTSSIPRLSFDAATTATAFAAAFYVARGAVAEPRGRELAFTALGIVGALVSTVFFLLWASTWGRWLSIPGAGLPPLTLNLPSTPYGHYYLVGTLALLLLPASLSLARRPVLWPLGAVGAFSSVAVVFMCGGRTVWLAALAALAASAVGAGRVSLPPRRWVVGAVAVIVVGTVVAWTPIVSRLLASSTVEGRLEIWGNSIGRWLDSPLIGHGPGTYSSQMILAGHEQLLKHGHNALIQMLVEGGLVGVTALLALAAGVAVIALRRQPLERAAFAGLAAFGVAAMTDNPSVFPFLVVPLIVWAAIAAPRQVEPLDDSSRLRTGVALVLAGSAGLAAASAIAAVAHYEAAAPAADRGDRPAVLASLRTAAALDPSHPMYQRDLGVWLLDVGQTAEARVHLARATQANPADLAAWRAAAIAVAEDDPDEAVRLARVALEMRETDPLANETIALIAQRAGDQTGRDAALANALRYEPWLAAADAWRATFPGDITPLLVAADTSWSERPEGAAGYEQARAWLAAMVGTPLATEQVDDVVNAAIAAAIDCEVAQARALIAGLPTDRSYEADVLLVRLLLARIEREPDEHVLTLARLRWPFLAFLATVDIEDSSPFSSLGDDVQIYGRRSVPAPPGIAGLPTSESGLSAWLRDPIAAADVGAPGSGLATCR